MALFFFVYFHVRWYNTIAIFKRSDTMDNLKELLNDKQYEAATSDSKYLRIIAGAGSGNDPAEGPGGHR